MIEWFLLYVMIITWGMNIMFCLNVKIQMLLQQEEIFAKIHLKLAIYV